MQLLHHAHRAKAKENDYIIKINISPTHFNNNNDRLFK